MKKKVILVIDDDRGILDVLEILLSEKGYHVVCIQNPSVLVNSIPNPLPNLILLDVRMSEMDGMSVSEMFRKKRGLKDIPLVIMTADFKVEEKAREAHANAFLKKPFDIQDVESVVKRFID